MTGYKDNSAKYDQYYTTPSVTPSYSACSIDVNIENGKNSWTEYKSNLTKLFYCFAGYQSFSKKKGIYMSRNELQTFLETIDGFTQHWTIDEVFANMDSDISDGKITLNEFIEYFCDKLVNPKINHMKKHIETQISWKVLLKALNIFEKFDTDHSEQLEYNEFKQFGQMMSLTEKETELLWYAIDIDNNGQISIVELFQWLKNQIQKQTTVAAFNDVDSICFQNVGRLLFALQTGIDITNINLTNFTFNNSHLISNMKRHYLLFSAINNDKNRTVLHRLVEELKINGLKNELKIFSSKFELISIHKTFNYCSYKININTENNALLETFKKCKYKIQKQNGLEYELKYDDELVIKQNGIYSIYISNCCDTYHLFQTIYCNQFRNNNFYEELGCKFKLIHKDSILKLRDISAIPKQYHQDIIYAKYLLVTCGNENIKIKNYYRFKNINQMNMILPFNPQCQTCDLYVQPTKYHKFVLLKKIKYNHKNTINAKLNHLFSVLKYYNQTITNPEKILNIFNFSLKQLKNELIHDLLQHKDMLYCMSKMKISMNKNVSILYRLINELKIKRLSSLLPIFECKLKQIETHKFKMNVNPTHKCFSKCEYKLENDKNEIKKSNVVIYFKCNDEVTIKHNGKFNIYVKCNDLFRCDQYILIRKMILNDLE